MDYIVKRGMGATKQIGQRIVGQEGIAVLATFAASPNQRHLVAALADGLRAQGHTLYDDNAKRFIVGDVGQLDGGGE
jgi:hypothetical protein